MKLPVELQEAIATALEDDVDALRALSLATKEFNSIARSILFDRITILSVTQLRELAELVLEPLLTLPNLVTFLVIRLPSPDPTDEEYDSEGIRRNLLDILGHFHSVRRLLVLDLPWMVSRSGVFWEYVEDYRGLRKFVVTGTYSSVNELTDALPHMETLESLVIDASWKRGDFHVIPQRATLSTHLKEVSMSAASMAFLVWMCSLRSGPVCLHLARFKVDAVSADPLFFLYICIFMEKYGPWINHLYLWLEECEDGVFERLGTALGHARRLYQLELFFPSEWEEVDAERYANAICVERRPQITRTRDAFAVNNEAEFWSKPHRGCGMEHVHIAIE